jgi:hypothetical protein
MREDQPQHSTSSRTPQPPCASSDPANIGAHLLGLRGPWVRAADLPELFCSWDLAYRCAKAGWLKPVLQGKRRTIYRMVDVLECLRRIEAGELPSPRPKKSAAERRCIG